MASAAKLIRSACWSPSRSFCWLPAQAPQPTTADGWTAAGWRALRAGAAEEASADFAQALRLNGAHPLALLGAGTAANVRGRADDARLHLTRALREQPSLTAASLLLGEILYRAADLDGAIGVYEQALARAPGDARLTARLESWRREAAVHDTFSTRIATHFTILFEGPGRPADGGARLGDARGHLLAGRRRARRVSEGHPDRRPLFEGAVPRRDAVPVVGRRPLRRTHPRAGRRARRREGAPPRADPRVHARGRLQPGAPRRAAVAERGSRDPDGARRHGAAAAPADSRGPVAGAARRIVREAVARGGARRLRDQRARRRRRCSIAPGRW